jgi:hypothetical protein
LIALPDRIFSTERKEHGYFLSVFLASVGDQVANDTTGFDALAREAACPGEQPRKRSAPSWQFHRNPICEIREICG